MLLGWHVGRCCSDVGYGSVWTPAELFGRCVQLPVHLVNMRCVLRGLRHTADCVPVFMWTCATPSVSGVSNSPTHYRAASWAPHVSGWFSLWSHVGPFCLHTIVFVGALRVSVSKQQLEAISLQVSVDSQSASTADGAAPEMNTAKLLSPASTCGRLHVSSDRCSDCCIMTFSSCSKYTDPLRDVLFGLVWSTSCFYLLTSCRCCQLIVNAGKTSLSWSVGTASWTSNNQK